MAEPGENSDVSSEAAAVEVGDHPAGIRRVAVIVAILSALAVVPYLTPGLERLQVWRSGDDVPFAGLIEFRSPRRADIAIGGAMRSQDYEPEDDAELMATAPLPEAVVKRGSRPAPPAQGPNKALRIPATELEGLTREIEDGSGTMEHFYRQLRRVASKQGGAMARMSVYGTSTLGSDRMTHVLREHFSERFGDGGKGFVPIAPGWAYQNHRDVEWEHRNWRTRVVNRGQEARGRYGYGGVLAMNGGPGSTSSWATVSEGAINRSVSRFRLFYQAFPGGGSALLTVDEGEPRALATDSTAIEDRVHEIEVPQGAHRLALAVGDGNLRMYGVVMERDGPGVVIDGLMLIGAFTRVLLHFDAEHIRTQVAQREPDLLVYWLGANDAVSESVPFEPDVYREQFGQVIARMRAGRPEASCMVMSVLDKGERPDGGGIRTIPRVPVLVQTQREVAEAAGCAFFDTYQAIGGENTMRRWYRNSPRLVTADLGHLTGPGARVVGNLVYKAFMKGYDDWLAGGGQ